MTIETAVQADFETDWVECRKRRGSYKLTKAKIPIHIGVASGK